MTALTNMAKQPMHFEADAGSEAGSAVVLDDFCTETSVTGLTVESARRLSRVKRCDDDNGWAVNVSIGTAHYKVISDTRYGGRKAALAVAKTWAKVVENKRRGEVASPPVTRNLPVTAVAGLSRLVVPIWRGDVLVQLRIFWLAAHPVSTTPTRTRSFSVFRFGEENAFWMAVTARKAFEREANGTLDSSHPPELSHIHRVERTRFGAWQVSITSNRSGREYSKRFPDLFYGDKTSSLAAAAVWRDEMVLRHFGKTKAAKR